MNSQLINEPLLEEPVHWNKKNPFKSFWMAGFECSDKLNAFGVRVDLLSATGHLNLLDHDYQNLAMFNMGTVREGVRWSQVESSPYRYDWSIPAQMIEAGKRNNIQQIWDLCHFGFPDDLTPLHPMFARRFAAFCSAFVKFYRSLQPTGELIVTPINEVSFLSWLGGDVRGTAPYCVGQGWEVKYRLMKAYIEGIVALKNADPTVRILTTEPLVSIVHTNNASLWEIMEASKKNDEQFQATDILCGRMCPELGGKPEYLDLIGYNYYYTNHWVHPTNEMLDWHIGTADRRFIPLHQLLFDAQRRYGRPVVLAETSHPKEDRQLWTKIIGTECKLTLEAGIPLLGVCWYPVLDRPDWDDLGNWHQSGLWDGAYSIDYQHRSLNIPLAKVLLSVQDDIGKTQALQKREHYISKV